jgi:RES domain-containing protein
MKPLTDRAREGRANSKGIPVIYLANDESTAVAEIRPWVGAYVSIGSFRIVRSLRIVNFDAGDAGRKLYLQEPSAPERERAVWADIDRAFATPINPSDDVADYAPTQIVAELFRTRGLDGIAYRSSLSTGHNLALFDVDSVELESCQLVDVERVEFKIRWHGGGYSAASTTISSE